MSKELPLNGTIFSQQEHFASVKHAARIAKAKLFTYRFSKASLILLLTLCLVTAGTVQSFAWNQPGNAIRNIQRNVRAHAGSNFSGSSNSNSNAHVNNSIHVNTGGGGGMAHFVSVGHNNNNGNNHHNNNNGNNHNNTKRVIKRVIVRKRVINITYPTPTPVYHPCTSCHPTFYNNNHNTIQYMKPSYTPAPCDCNYSEPSYPSYPNEEPSYQTPSYPTPNVSIYNSNTNSNEQSQNQSQTVNYNPDYSN